VTTEAKSNGEWRTASCSSGTVHRGFCATKKAGLSDNEIASPMSRVTEDASIGRHGKAATAKPNWTTRNRELLPLKMPHISPRSLPRKPAHFACQRPPTNSMISGGDPHRPHRSRHAGRIEHRAFPDRLHVPADLGQPADLGSSGQQVLSLTAPPFGRKHFIRRAWTIIC
jgi:hypothetical protein